MSDSRKDGRAEIRRSGIFRSSQPRQTEKPDEETRENGVKYRNYSAERQSLDAAEKSGARDGGSGLIGKLCYYRKIFLCSLFMHDRVFNPFAREII